MTHNNYKVFGSMEVGNLMEDAGYWWDTKGSDLLRHRQFSDDTKEQQQAMDATNPLHVNYIGGQSGILLGKDWDALTPDERYRVLKVYTLTLKETVDASEES